MPSLGHNSFHGYPPVQPSYYPPPVPQYQPQRPHSYMPRLGHNSFHGHPPVQPPSYMPLTYYPQVPYESYGYSPMYYPIQQPYDVRPPLEPAYNDRVQFVDGVAIILVASVERSDDYEDLLDLPEQMGRVNVGLSKEMISENLKTSRVDAASKDKEEGGEICAVCQEEYKLNEMVGTLHCGHRYHENCIKQWLLHKNVCPICKAKALMA